MFEVRIGFGKTDRDNPNYGAEEEILNEWIPLLEDRYNSKFEIVHNSSDYSTLCPKGCLDIIRVKYSDRSKWIKIRMTNESSVLFRDDERFETQKNKNESMWRSNLTDTDIRKYFDVLDYAYDNLTKQ